MATPPPWARSQWSKELPSDLINANDVVVDRWFKIASAAEPTDAAGKVEKSETTTTLSLADVATLEARLAALEKSFQVHNAIIGTPLNCGLQGTSPFGNPYFKRPTRPTPY
jgi:hypothetical protein